MIALRTVAVATAVGVGLGSAPAGFAQSSALGAGLASAPVQNSADASSLGVVVAYSRDRPERQEDRVDRADRPGGSVAASSDGPTAARPPRGNGTQPKE